MRAVFDTRFFMVSLESKDEEFRKWSRRAIETLERKGNVGFIPSIVIHEFYQFQMEKLGKEVADTRVNSVLKLNFNVVNLDGHIGIAAAKLRCKYAELPTGDAIIAATAMATSSEFVLTDDKHIKQIKETKTRWA